MSDFYTRRQAFATRMHAKYKQGEVIYTIDGPSTGPAYDPTPGAPIDYPLNATVETAGEYANGTSIQLTDALIKFPVLLDDAGDPVEVSQEGRFTIDGKTVQTIKVIRVPGAGTVIQWRVIARG